MKTEPLYIQKYKEFQEALEDEFLNGGAKDWLVEEYNKMEGRIYKAYYTVSECINVYVVFSINDYEEGNDEIWDIYYDKYFNEALDVEYRMKQMNGEDDGTMSLGWVYFSYDGYSRDKDYDGVTTYGSGSYKCFYSKEE